MILVNIVIKTHPSSNSHQDFRHLSYIPNKTRYIYLQNLVLEPHLIVFKSVTETSNIFLSGEKKTGQFFLHHYAEAHSETCQTLKVGFFAKVVNGLVVGHFHIKFHLRRLRGLWIRLCYIMPWPLSFLVPQ